MAGFIFFIIIIIVIVRISKAAQEQQTTVNKYLNNAINQRTEVKREPNSVNNEASYLVNRQPNSYYNNLHYLSSLRQLNTHQ